MQDNKLKSRIVKIDRKVKAEVKRPVSLYDFCMTGDVKFVEMLIEQGADINSTCDNGELLLYNMIKANKMSMAAFLIKHGADPLIENSKGLTPLDAFDTNKTDPLTLDDCGESIKCLLNIKNPLAEKVEIKLIEFQLFAIKYLYRTYLLTEKALENSSKVDDEVNQSILSGYGFAEEYMNKTRRNKIHFDFFNIGLKKLNNILNKIKKAYIHADVTNSRRFDLHLKTMKNHKDFFKRITREVMELKSLSLNADRAFQNDNKKKAATLYLSALEKLEKSKVILPESTLSVEAIIANLQNILQSSTTEQSSLMIAKELISLNGFVAERFTKKDRLIIGYWLTKNLMDASNIQKMILAMRYGYQTKLLLMSQPELAANCGIDLSSTEICTQDVISEQLLQICNNFAIKLQAKTHKHLDFSWIVSNTSFNATLCIEAHADAKKLIAKMLELSTGRRYRINNLKLDATTCTISLNKLYALDSGDLDRLEKLITMAIKKIALEETATSPVSSIAVRPTAIKASETTSNPFMILAAKEEPESEAVEVIVPKTSKSRMKMINGGKVKSSAFSSTNSSSQRTRKKLMKASSQVTMVGRNDSSPSIIKTAVPKHQSSAPVGRAVKDPVAADTVIAEPIKDTRVGGRRLDRKKDTNQKISIAKRSEDRSTTHDNSARVTRSTNPVTAYGSKPLYYYPQYAKSFSSNPLANISKSELDELTTSSINYAINASDFIEELEQMFPTSKLR